MLLLIKLLNYVECWTEIPPNKLATSNRTFHTLTYGSHNSKSKSTYRILGVVRGVSYHIIQYKPVPPVPTVHTYRRVVKLRFASKLFLIWLAPTEHGHLQADGRTDGANKQRKHTPNPTKQPKQHTQPKHVTSGIFTHGCSKWWERERWPKILL